MYLNDINDINKNIEEYNLNKEHKIVVVFDDVVVYMLSNRNFNK